MFPVVVYRSYGTEVIMPSPDDDDRLSRYIKTLLVSVPASDEILPPVHGRKAPGEGKREQPSGMKESLPQVFH